LTGKVEYEFPLVLIALICVVSIGAVGQAVSNSFSNAAQNLSTATT
jgi:Flp pilus assembly pilin Flp